MTRVLLAIVVLMLVYSMILLSLRPWDLAIGAALAAGVLVMFRRHLFGDTLEPLPGFVKRAGSLLRFGWFVYTDVIEGLWLVLSIMLGLRPLPRSGIVAIPIGERTPGGVAVTAWVTGLSPGSVMIDVDWQQRVMLIHFIDVSEPEELRRKMQNAYERYQRPIFP